MDYMTIFVVVTCIQFHDPAWQKANTCQPAMNAIYQTVDDCRVIADRINDNQQRISNQRPDATSTLKTLCLKRDIPVAVWTETPR
jgi:hypothetical protein